MNYRNPIYTKDGWIDCEIEHPTYGWIPFTCNPNDTGALFDTAVLFEQMKDSAAPFVPPPPPTVEQVAEEIRAERNRRLTESDWTQLPDVPEVSKLVWAEYRQALRDFTLQPEFPWYDQTVVEANFEFNVVVSNAPWPVQPT